MYQIKEFLVCFVVAVPLEVDAQLIQIDESAIQGLHVIKVLNGTVVFFHAATEQLVHQQEFVVDADGRFEVADRLIL